MAQITERLSDEHFLMLQRALRKKAEGEAAFAYAVEHVRNFAGLGEMDSVNIELGLLIRLVPDEPESEPEFKCEGTDE